MGIFNILMNGTIELPTKIVGPVDTIFYPIYGRAAGKQASYYSTEYSRIQSFDDLLIYFSKSEALGG